MFLEFDIYIGSSPEAKNFWNTKKAFIDISKITSIKEGNDWCVNWFNEPVCKITFKKGKSKRVKKSYSEVKQMIEDLKAKKNK